MVDLELLSVKVVLMASEYNYIRVVKYPFSAFLDLELVAFLPRTYESSMKLLLSNHSLFWYVKLNRALSGKMPFQHLFDLSAMDIQLRPASGINATAISCVMAGRKSTQSNPRTICVLSSYRTKNEVKAHAPGTGSST